MGSHLFSEGGGTVAPLNFVPRYLVHWVELFDDGFRILLGLSQDWYASF